jgi:L-asparaginase II
VAAPADLVTEPAHPVLARVVRGGVVESVHRGSVVAVRADGSTALALGDPDAPVFPRSCLKPLQAAGLLRAGLGQVLVPGRDDDLLALAAASHSGEPRHVAGARRLLALVGLDDRALRNRPLLPLGDAAAADVLRGGGRPSAVTADCSGKHAAMLATVVVRGEDVDGYLEPDSPVQTAVRAEVERAVGGPVAAPTVDGCGAPLFAVPLRRLASALGAYARTPDSADSAHRSDGADSAHRSDGADSAHRSDGDESAGRRVADAMRAHPEMVGGGGRAVSGLMRAVPGLVVKDGADGVVVAATADGAAVALKLDDGAARGRVPVLVSALAALGVNGAALAAWREEPVVGGSEVVGSLVSALW